MRDLDITFEAGVYRDLNSDLGISVSVEIHRDASIWKDIKIALFGAIDIASFFPGNGVATAVRSPGASSLRVLDDAVEVGGDAFSLTRHGQLTNGVYTVSKESMKSHVVGGIEGKSIFYPTINAEEAVLKAAQYADEMGLWIGNKAKVQVTNTNIGTLGDGTPTNVINVYRKETGFIHGSPGGSIK